MIGTNRGASLAKLDDLERFEAFRHLSQEGRALLSQGLTQMHVPRALSLFHKGQPVSGAIVVLAGRLRVFSIAPNGVEATLYFVDPGETCVLTLNCLFSDLLFPAWVQSEAAASVAVIPGAVYRRLFDLEPGIRNLTVAALSTAVQRLMAELEDVHASNHRQRLAQFVLRNASSDGTLTITQQKLAQHLGTTREVVARLMQDFVAQDILRTARGSIAIRDLFALRGVVVPDASGTRRISRSSPQAHHEGKKKGHERKAKKE